MWIFKSKKLTLLIVLLLPAIGLVLHELSLSYYQDKTCVICHEMKEPIERWKNSGTGTNHNNCTGCHFKAGFDGWLEMNKSALRQLVQHFKRGSKEPIKPLEEPLFLEDGLEPGYWSRVPNSRCYQCKEAKNHKEIDQPRIHEKLVQSIETKPCMDCHNHEMRKGQKFYEKITEDTGKTAALSMPAGS